MSDRILTPMEEMQERISDRIAADIGRIDYYGSFARLQSRFDPNMIARWASEEFALGVIKAVHHEACRRISGEVPTDVVQMGLDGGWQTTATIEGMFRDRGAPMPDPVIEGLIASRIAMELDLDQKLQTALGGLLQCADDVCRHPRAGKSVRRRVVHLAAQARYVCDLGAALTAPGRIAP